MYYDEFPEEPDPTKWQWFWMILAIAFLGVVISSMIELAR